MKPPASPLHRRGTRLRVWVGVLTLAGLAGQATIYLGRGDQASLNVGLPLVIAAGLIVGVSYGLADRPLDGVGTAAPVAGSKAAPAWGDILTYTLAQLVGGELLGITALLFGRESIALALFAPLLYGGLFTFVASFVGSLAAGMVLWPLAEVFLAGERAVRGRPVNRRLLAVSLALLTVVAFAVFLALSTHVTAADAAPRQRGIVMIARLFVDYSGDVSNQIEAWIARGLLVALAVEVVWALRARPSAVSHSAESGVKHLPEVHGGP